jgi:hypothetical protein
MLTITLSDTEGNTITSNHPDELADFYAFYGEFDVTDVDRSSTVFEDDLRAGRLDRAGILAYGHHLMFSFAYSPDPARATYLVPVDPADATQCESCQ